MRLMLLMDYTGTGVDWRDDWLMSEKFDGVRAYWDGSRLWTRGENEIHVPYWWSDSMPAIPLDGELYLGHGTLGRMAGIARKWAPVDADWQEVRYRVFDAPFAVGGFRARHLDAAMAIRNTPQCLIVDHLPATDESAVRRYYKSTLARGGEGVVLRMGYAPYEHGRSRFALKIKPDNNLWV